MAWKVRAVDSVTFQNTELKTEAKTELQKQIPGLGCGWGQFLWKVVLIREGAVKVLCQSSPGLAENRLFAGLGGLRHFWVRPKTRLGIFVDKELNQKTQSRNNTSGKQQSVFDFFLSFRQGWRAGRTEEEGNHRKLFGGMSCSGCLVAFAKVEESSQKQTLFKNCTLNKKQSLTAVSRDSTGR